MLTKILKSDINIAYLLSDKDSTFTINVTRIVIFAFCYEKKLNSSLSVAVNPRKTLFTHGQFQVKDLMITKNGMIKLPEFS